MAVAEIIGAAIGVMLLLVVAYMLVGSVLTTAEVVTTAQKDITLQQEIRLRTSFEIRDPKTGVVNEFPDAHKFINISINNTGTEVICDFSHMDIFTYNDVLVDYQHLTNDACGTIETSAKPGTWCVSGDIDTTELDPDKTMWINVTLFDPSHNSIRVVTSNGVYDSTTI